jgi:hypothetical protein
VPLLELLTQAVAAVGVRIHSLLLLQAVQVL